MAPGPSAIAVAVVCVACFLLGRWSAAPSADPPLQRMEAEVAQGAYSVPLGHGVVAVPSVLKDVRGEVHNLRIGGFRFNVLVSHFGVLRSGDVHTSRQFDLIFSGSIKVTMRRAGRDIERMYGSGDLVVIPAHVPHIFEFLSFTVMVEWWEGQGFDAQYFRPYRKRIDEAMTKMTKLSEAANGAPASELGAPDARRPGQRG
jgi:hypothetical protein